VRLRLKSCPKCKGDVMVDRDEYGWYEHCLQCGHRRDMESLVEAHEQHCDREKLQPRSTSRQKTKVSIFSHQPLLQEGILHSLSSTKDIEVISQAKTSDKESIIKIIPADVVILDVDGPSENGLGLVQRLKQRLPGVGVIVLTSNPSDDRLFQAVENRVAAYLSKEIIGDQLAEMVRRVAHGEYPINESLSSQPELAGKILNQFQELSGKTEEEALIARLSTREAEVLNYVAQGYSNKQVAAKLDISEQTIKNHVTNIMTKLNARARTQAVVMAAQQGLISIA